MSPRGCSHYPEGLAGRGTGKTLEAKPRALEDKTVTAGPLRHLMVSSVAVTASSF